MDWPPQAGELLPRADEPVGVREKLERYSLNASHVSGGDKAKGFASILGITLKSAGHLEDCIVEAIQTTAINTVVFNPPYGWKCVVEFPVAGVGSFSGRSVRLRTVWEVTRMSEQPRLVNAFLKP